MLEPVTMSETDSEEKDWLILALRCPAAWLPLAYILGNFILWESEAGGMPVVGSIFASVLTGSANAVLLVVCALAWRGNKAMQVAVALCSLLLVAFVPLSFEMMRQLPTDAQAALVVPFWGAPACILHLLLSCALCFVARRFTRKCLSR